MRAERLTVPAGMLGPTRLMALACFASMACMRICDAMLPALTSHFEISISDASLVISTFAISYGLMQLVHGPLGDRFGKAQVIAFGALVAGAAAFAAMFSASFAWLVLCRVFMGAGAAAIVPLTMAAITSRASGAERHLALAGLLTYTVTGMMAGTWAGGAIAQVLSWRIAFGLVGMILVGGGIGLLASVRRDGPPSGSAPASALSRIQVILRNPWARTVLVVTCAEGALIFGVVALVPSMLHERFAVSGSVAGGVLAMYAVGGLVYSRLAARMLRHFSAAGLARAGGAFVCTAFVVLAVMPHWTWAIAACLLAGFGFYMFHNTLQASAAQMCDEARGTAMSLFSCVLFIGESAGISVMAWAAQGSAVVAPFAIAGVVLLLVAGFFSALLEERRAVSP